MRQAIIYLDRNFFDFYGSNLSQVTRFDFSPYTNAMEVVKGEELTQAIQAFVTQNTILPTALIFILSENALFPKALPATVENMSKEKENFIDNVPFDQVVVRDYPIENGMLLLAANKDFYGSISEGFKKLKFTTEAVVPIFLANVTIDPSIGLDPQSAESMLANIETLKQKSFEMKTPEVITPSHSQATVQKKDNKRTIMLAAVFGILIVILVIVIFASNSSSSTPPKTPAASTVPAAAAVLSPTPLSVPAATNSGTNSAALTQATIKIVVSSSPLTAAEAVKNQLVSLGFNNVVIESNPSSSPTTPIFLYSPSVPPDIQEKLFKLVSINYPSIISQSGTPVDGDVNISLGQ